MQSGRLIVTGHDRVEIVLSERPEKIKVHFVDDSCDVPCNHGHHDKLSWFLHKKEYHHGHRHHHHKSHYSSQCTLTIIWDVHNVREIAWAVYF